jgi:hypothetical protein
MRFREFIEATVTADMPIQQRLAAGWSAEKKVIDAFNRMIGPTTTSSEYADKGDSKIDAIVDVKGKSYLMQIKSRESGDDILVEWYRDYPTVIGRDQKTRADWYAVLSSNGTQIMVVDTQEVKEACKRMVDVWEKSNHQQTQFPEGEISLQASRDRPGAYKLIVFLNKKQFRMKVPKGFPLPVSIINIMKQP